MEEVALGIVDSTAGFDEAFDTEMEALPPKGTYVVTLTGFEPVPARQLGSIYNDVFKPSTDEDGNPIFTKAFYRLTYTATNGTRIESRLYPKAVASFAKNIARQLDYTTIAMKTSELLAHLKTHQITVWVDYSSQYGLQVSYYDTELYRARKLGEHRVVR